MILCACNGIPNGSRYFLQIKIYQGANCEDPEDDIICWEITL